MRVLSDSELLSLREMLQMETNALAKVKATKMVVTDDELKCQVDAAEMAAEKRVRGIQQFISENNILVERGVE
jgi:transaldolase